MAREFVTPERLKPGDKVAIIAPSSGAAAVFPHVYKLGLKRLQEVFGLEPVEFPTAQKDSEYLAKNPQARADDINNAFADPKIKAVIATIGGDDQLRVLKFLDWDLLKNNPKAFLGFSDNTNLHIILWNLGIVSYYGGNLMNQFAMQGKMHEYTKEFIKKALFDDQIGEIRASDAWTDKDLDWADQTTLNQERPMDQNPGWVWHNAEKGQVEGRLWGGCLESLDFHLRAGKYLPENEELSGGVLFLETSEELPSSDYVHRVLLGMGEKGMLEKFKAVLVGRPKTRFINNLPPEGREKFVENQREAIIKMLREYAPGALAIFGLDFGHTDPQLLVPNGGI
ncbi:LD-carboxypeptidase, partial [Candidatus Microgenomates bacterium]|nr:LD-carboxypeptidase [Candidatus Microgenomates bacterium]